MIEKITLESPNDQILQEDLEHIANSDIPLEGLQNCTILITGATGLIGSNLVKTLICCNRIKKSNIRILALVRNMNKARGLFQHLLDFHPELCLINGDVLSYIEIEEKIDYIIHGASITSSKEFVVHPVETIKTTLKGTENILELAKQHRVKSMVYLSSMEAFGITDPELEKVAEENLGYIDILNTRSSYSEGKRMAECMCAAYAQEYDISIKIARLSQTFGTGISPEENRVFAQFAKSAINGTDIILHTKGESTGNYCYTRDAIIALLLLLIKGNKGEAYIVTNETTNIKIKDMAQMVADKFAEGKISVVFDIPKSEMKYGYAPDVKMKLSAQKLRSLGWKPEVGLEEAYSRMIQSMKSQKVIKDGTN
ncbi:NAD-dependent epimerase/dehydratase family protein [Schinkia azotoformans]|uniref:NAD-dependent epimerase/dehydratase family protein n=1 Tax=Schinkia azotoformans TaxID=1454 RepID=UPI002DBCBC4B|nr:NAD-dependent epimerase/dehydratase family protein [Schinkia azotoformans]MEC1714853.1 NAD-dependent epimerase/dehydratase family protein [Schinkia azotoformans]